MRIHVKQKSKKTNKSREWVFHTLEDINFGTTDNTDNKIVFSRYHVYDKGGRPIKTYDVTSNEQKNCTWKEACPSDKVLELALKKFLSSYTFHIDKQTEPVADYIP